MPTTRMLRWALAVAVMGITAAHGADATSSADASAAESVPGKRAARSAKRPAPVEDPRRIAAQEEAKERAEEAKQAEARRISRERRAREEEARWLARSRACLIKPVMSDDEIRRCREAGNDAAGR